MVLNVETPALLHTMSTWPKRSSVDAASTSTEWRSATSVRTEWTRSAASAPSAVACVVERLQLDVGDHDPAAGGEERAGEAEPDPTGAAGDHRDLVLELVHAHPPWAAGMVTRCARVLHHAHDSARGSSRRHRSSRRSSGLPVRRIPAAHGGDARRRAASASCCGWTARRARRRTAATRTAGSTSSRHRAACRCGSSRIPPPPPDASDDERWIRLAERGSRAAGHARHRHARLHGRARR